MLERCEHKDFTAHPLLVNWLSDIGCSVEDIEEVNIAHDIERDKDYEERHYDGWKHWKYGKDVTFAIVLKNGKVHRRNFERTVFYGQEEPS